MSKEFSTLMEYLENLRDQYLEALYAFSAYKALRKLRAHNLIPEDEAQKNAAVMTRFKNFFGPVENSLFKISLLELAKIFDESNQSLHITAILNYVNGNKTKLTRDDFQDFNQGRPFLDGLYKQYEGMDAKDMQSVKDSIEEHKDALGKLKNYRDQYLAHNDKKKVPINITFDEVESLFTLAEETLNLFTRKLNDSSTMYSHIDREVMNDAKSVLDFLHRFEPYRRKELDERLRKTYGQIAS